MELGSGYGYSAPPRQIGGGPSRAVLHRNGAHDPGRQRGLGGRRQRADWAAHPQALYASMPDCTRAWRQEKSEEYATTPDVPARLVVTLFPGRASSAGRRGPSRGSDGKAMLGQHGVDVRPSHFFTDQYDPRHGIHRVILARLRPGHLPPIRGLTSGHRFWLREQRIQAGMNINIWDVAEDIERLIQHHARSTPTNSPIRLSR
jgi:hypothetical protein